DHDDHDDHDHGQVGDVDPHAWIDPQIAIAWVDDIETALSQADPDNSDTYAANAAATIASLNALDDEIAAQLADLSQRTLVVPHDAYHYFGVRYDLPASGSISFSDATTPGPDRIAALQDLIRENDITCVLSDPQSRREWVDLVREGTDANTALADPLGTAYAQGPDHYAATLRGLANAYAACLAD
ncbi:MAG TPA: hypothetical protein DIT67_06080, partial [Octadecabacter sp.]|nr:hypothetical protein [Octadecabacter sp.]